MRGGRARGGAASCLARDGRHPRSPDGLPFEFGALHDGRLPTITSPRDRLHELRGELSAGDRAFLVEAAIDRVRTHLPADHHVGVLADLARIEGDPSLLDAARDVLAALSPALLPSNPDRVRPALSVARAARALGQTYTLDVDGEEDELEVLLALGTSDERRVVALAASLEWPLWVVVRSRPELAQAAVQALVSMCDPDSIWREGCALLPWLGPPRVRSALDAILPHAPASLDAHADSWVSLLDVVARTATLPPDSFDPVLLEPHTETARASIVLAALTHARERLAARLG